MHVCMRACGNILRLHNMLCVSALIGWRFGGKYFAHAQMTGWDDRTPQRGGLGNPVSGCFQASRSGDGVWRAEGPALQPSGPCRRPHLWRIHEQNFTVLRSQKSPKAPKTHKNHRNERIMGKRPPLFCTFSKPSFGMAFFSPAADPPRALTPGWAIRQEETCEPRGEPTFQQTDNDGKGVPLTPFGGQLGGTLRRKVTL